MRNLIYLLFALILISCERDLVGPSFDVKYRGTESGFCEGEYFTKAFFASFNVKSSLVKIYRVTWIDGQVDTLTTALFPYNMNHGDLVVGGATGRIANDYNPYFDYVIYWLDKDLIWYFDGKEYRTNELLFFGDMQDV